MSTSGTIIHIPAADVATLPALPTFITFEDGTGQTAEVFSAIVNGGIGILSLVVGACTDGSYEAPVSHASGTPLASSFGSGDQVFSVGAFSLLISTTSPVPVTTMFLDSLEHWDTVMGGVSHLTDKYTAKPAGGVSVVASFGLAFQFGGSVLGKTLPLESPALTVGVYGTYGALNGTIINLSNVNGTMPTFSLEWGTAGAIQVTFGTAGPTVIPTFVGTINTEYSFEVQAVLSENLRCDFRVKVWSGLTKLVDYSNFLTQTFCGNNKWATFSFGGPGGGNTANIGNIYVTTIGFLGNASIVYLRANDPGDQTQGVVSNGTGPNWKMNSDYVISVAVAVPDDDATTVDLSTVNTRDIYRLLPVAQVSGKTIVSSQFIGGQRHTGTDPSTAMLALVTEATELDTGIYYSCAFQYTFQRLPRSNNPVTYKPWTWPEVNAAQSGFLRRT